MVRAAGILALVVSSMLPWSASARALASPVIDPVPQVGSAVPARTATVPAIAPGGSRDLHVVAVARGGGFSARGGMGAPRFGGGFGARGGMGAPRFGGGFGHPGFHRFPSRGFPFHHHVRPFVAFGFFAPLYVPYYSYYPTNPYCDPASVYYYPYPPWCPY